MCGPISAATWMAGDALSLADLLLAPHLSMLAQASAGVQILREHGNLNHWLARIEARPSHASDHLGYAARTGGSCGLTQRVEF
jgi:glutathione S-transferase